jgi:Leucine-rich repeat (LRR) protein
LLKELNVQQTEITDASLPLLGKLNRLEVLGLHKTQITDVGLVHLSGLKKLKDLDVSDTGVTSEGTARLQEKLPNCEILLRRRPLPAQ